MPFGLELHIPNVHSLMLSEYECDLISRSSEHKVSLKNMYFSPFVNILTQVTKLDSNEHFLCRSCLKYLSTCPAKNQAGCTERVVHHSHENKKFYLFKIAINEKCQKPKLTVKAITVAMATAV